MVKRLTDWYAHARKAFDGVSGPVDLTLFLTLPADTIDWLAARAPEGERHWRVVENLQERVQAAFGDTVVPGTLTSKGVTLTLLGDALRAAAETLGEVAEILDGCLAAPASPRELVALVEEALAVAAVRFAIEHAEVARALLAERFQGLETDFAPINAVIEWSQALRRAELPADVGTWLLCPAAAANLLALRSALETLEVKWQALEAATRAFDRFGVLDWEAWQRGDSEDAMGIEGRARKALAGFDGLWVWAGFSRARHRVDELGLSILTAHVLNGQLTGPEVGPAFGFLFYNSIARAILRENPTLIEFSGLSHEQLRQAFAELDKEVIKLNGRHCAHAIDQRANMAPRGLGSGSPKSKYPPAKPGAYLLNLSRLLQEEGPAGGWGPEESGAGFCDGSAATSVTWPRQVSSPAGRTATARLPTGAWAAALALGRTAVELSWLWLGAREEAFQGGLQRHQVTRYDLHTRGSCTRAYWWTTTSRNPAMSSHGTSG